MFAVTLLTNENGAGIDPALPEALRDAWGGGALTWLAPGTAVAFDIIHKPGVLWQVWQELQAQSIDLVVLPKEGRRKRLLLADMDSTMIRQECIDELADEAGVGKEVAEITARAMNGELDFEAALEHRVALLKGLEAQVIHKVLETRITYMPGGATLVATMRANRAKAVLVSGGFTAFSEPVAAYLGFDAHRANRLEIDQGRLIGEVSKPILGRAAKVRALDELTAELGIGPEEVIAVGDGANDLGMLARAGIGVALHAKPAVAAQCDARINFGDLTALLYLQGYAQSEFVTPRT